MPVHAGRGEVQAAMRVSELVEALKDVPQDAEVMLEGCDCVHPWDGRVEVEESLLRPSVYLGVEY